MILEERISWTIMFVVLGRGKVMLCPCLQTAHESVRRLHSVATSTPAAAAAAGAPHHAFDRRAWDVVVLRETGVNSEA